MTNLKERVARNILAIKAAREIIKEIEELGVDDLKRLADTGQSIVGIYLSRCSPERKVTIKRYLNELLQMGVTPDMILDKVARQMPELAPIIKSMDSYRKAQIETIMSFLKED